MTDYRQIASALYDGGWRAIDKYALMDEYDLRPDDAEIICNYLLEFDLEEM